MLYSVASAGLQAELEQVGLPPESSRALARVCEGRRDALGAAFRPRAAMRESQWRVTLDARTGERTLWVRLGEEDEEVAFSGADAAALARELREARHSAVAAVQRLEA